MSAHLRTYTKHKVFFRFIGLLLLPVLISFSGISQTDSVTVALPDSTAQFSDTIYLYKSDMESIVTYASRDSIFTDLRANKIHLWGEAHLTYEGIDMRAEYLVIDLEKNEVSATYLLDSLGNRIGEPVFTDNGDTIHAATLRYNFDSKKGYIQEVAIRQDEIYLTMEKAKRQANEEIHFINGKFTTCNLKEPHFHFFLSKAVMIPEKRIVTGPMNLWIMGVPTPLGLPFSVIPQKKDKERKAGFIMPQIAAFSPYGMGLSDLGYYIPVSERFQTTFYGTIFTRGSFGIKNVSEYAKRYKYNGNFEASYNLLREGFPSTLQNENTLVRWTHNQDPKANPFWKFTSNVNFNSQNNNKAVLNQQTDAYFNNSMNSDIRLDRYFPGKPFQMSLRTSMRQNAQNPIINLTAPVFNFTSTRFFPFKRKKAADGKTKLYETIGFTYNMEAKNQSDFKARYLKNNHFDSIAGEFRNGATHTAVMTTTVNAFKNTFRFTPSITYNQKYNFQTINKSLDSATNSIVVDSVNRGALTQNLNFSLGVTNNIYSYYRFIGKKRTLLRHIATPSATISGSPNIQNGIRSVADTLGNIYEYSIHENSVYSERYLRGGKLLSLSLGNTFEIKQKSDKDTVTGFRKIRLIENLNFTDSYDFERDSMNWTNLNIRMVINPIQPLSFVVTGDHSWYGWNRETGQSVRQFASNTGQGLGRLVSLSFATTYSLTPKVARKEIPAATTMASVWNPQYQRWLLVPTQIIDFEIPWRFTFSHILSYSLNSGIAEYQKRKYFSNHTLSVSGDVSITENWKIAANTYIDLGNKTVTNTRIDLYRNLHCWNMSFNWTPIGTNKSFLISIRGNGTALSNAILNLRRPASLFSQ